MPESHTTSLSWPTVRNTEFTSGTALPAGTKDFPCGSAGKESACNAGGLGSIPGLRRSPAEGKGNPLWYSGLANSMDGIFTSQAPKELWCQMERTRWSLVHRLSLLQPLWPLLSFKCSFLLTPPIFWFSCSCSSPGMITLKLVHLFYCWWTFETFPVWG